MLMIKRDNTSPFTPARTVLGILMDTELLLLEAVQGKRVLRSLQLPADVSEPGRLLEHLWDAGLDSAWVMPATTLSRAASCAWLEQASNCWVVRVHPDPQEPTRPIRALLWPRERNQWEARRLALAFPEYAGWGWELTDARSLLATVSYLHQVLARSVTGSPDLLAHELLNDLTPDAAYSPRGSSPIDLYALAGSGATRVPLRECARDVVWMRPLSVMERHQRYVHKYVHLSWHLQAAMGVPLGEGAPQFCASGRAYDGVRPGIWRAHAERAGSVFDGKQLPSGLDGEWMSTPQVRCCQDIGYRVQVREGWYWQEAASRLQMHPQVVGMGRALLFAQLVNLVRKGTMPVLVERNAFWVISDEAHPPSAVPGLVTTQPWRGYTAGYGAPLLLTTEIRDAFKRAQHAGGLTLALDTLAGEALP